ncbi:MAG TPA: preprotein translocase subunit SecE [Thermoanaerobaculia bacterium]|jgi:preprotein translocase subunit SecE|nr:preprotein translocase subunit SecE [Thermoanaerobaculia bacterium]HQR65957.1 preprotein translocase subunit SecE [Thermoanaerobaculia bacterium]
MNLSQKWATFREFLSDVKKESGKVTWPGKDEVVGTTTVVLVYMAIVGAFLFLVDAAVTPLVNKLFAAFGS